MGRPKILVIEDEIFIATMVQEILEDLGCEVEGPFTTVADGLDACRTMPADACVLNLVLKGEFAYEIAEVLAQRHIPFGFASGIDPADTLGEWSSRPFLAKPYSTDDVRAFVQQLLPEYPLQA